MGFLLGSLLKVIVLFVFRGFVWFDILDMFEYLKLFGGVFFILFCFCDF